MRGANQLKSISEGFLSARYASHNRIVGLARQLCAFSTVIMVNYTTKLRGCQIFLRKICITVKIYHILWFFVNNFPLGRFLFRVEIRPYNLAPCLQIRISVILSTKIMKKSDILSKWRWNHHFAFAIMIYFRIFGDFCQERN